MLEPAWYSSEVQSKEEEEEERHQASQQCAVHW